VKKNWLLLLFLPELAMLSMPAASCFSLSPGFSSLNFPPYMESPPEPSPAAEAVQHMMTRIKAQHVMTATCHHTKPSPVAEYKTTHDELQQGTA
jgi:hypothetical protein